MKTVKIDRKFVAAIIAIILVGTVVCTHLTTLYFPQTVTIKATGPEDPLEAWSESTMIMWQYNSTHYASRNMSTLMVEVFLTNVTHVEELSIGNITLLTNGGTLFLKQLEHNGSLTVPANVLIMEHYNNAYHLWGKFLVNDQNMTGPIGYIADPLNGTYLDDP
jgi:hypothetical protein